jgi:hypothetical protein
MAMRTRRRPSVKPRPAAALPVRPPAELTALTDEWWSSWRRANALGWDYLNAVSGLMRLNLDALTRASRFGSPFAPQ